MFEKPWNLWLISTTFEKKTEKPKPMHGISTVVVAVVGSMAVFVTWEMFADGF